MSLFQPYNTPIVAHLLVFQDETGTSQAKPAEPAKGTELKAAEPAATAEKTTETKSEPENKVGVKGKTPQQKPPEAPQMFDMFSIMLPLIIVLLILQYLFVSRPEEKAKKKQQETFDGMKKNDVVVTYSGIFGTIHDFSADGKEVILKLEENAKIRIRKASIESVIKAPSSATPTT